MSEDADEDNIGAANGAGSLLAQAQPNDVIDLFEQVLSSPYSNASIRQYVIVASTKLSIRLDEVGNSVSNAAEAKERLDKLVRTYQSSVELELQQRAVEFGALLNGVDRNIRLGVLERMPPPELKASVMGTGEAI
jgi:AP-1 complex subunit gamma-1